MGKLPTDWMKSLFADQEMGHAYNAQKNAYIAQQQANYPGHPAQQYQPNYPPPPSPPTPPPAHIATRKSLVRDRAEAAIDRAIAQLPFRVLAKVSEIRFGGYDPFFEVLFYSRELTLTFDNVDSFPTEADIARICLECP